jgi:hypothetical protein
MDAKTPATCEVPPTRTEVNAFPRAQSCSHRSDLPSARSPTLERQKVTAKTRTPPELRSWEDIPAVGIENLQ